MNETFVANLKKKRGLNTNPTLSLFPRQVLFTIVDVIGYNKMSNSPLVQYVVIRKDLIKVLNWSVGAVVAQACHATAAAVHLFYDDPHTKKYLEDIDSMHKIILEIPDEDSIKQLENQLSENGIQFKTWIEKPENIPTCIVLKPYPKNDVQSYFKKLKLFKDN